jgi:hypothetical protein
MKKTALALIIFGLLSSYMAVIEIVDFVGANPYPYTNCDSSFVTVSIVSPENKTYNTNSVLLNITAGAYPGVWFLGYSLDDTTYIEIAPGHPLAHILTETVLLEQLPKGSHSIEVKATAMANDEDGQVIAYSKVYFTITKALGPTPTPIPTSTPKPTSTPSPEPTPVLEAFPTSLVLMASVGIALAAIGLFVYFKKRK